MVFFPHPTEFRVIDLATSVQFLHPVLMFPPVSCLAAMVFLVPVFLHCIKQQHFGELRIVKESKCFQESEVIRETKWLCRDNLQTKTKWHN
jgi:hypothetical protein